jgi:hypothetical protein
MQFALINWNAYLRARRFVIGLSTALLFSTVASSAANADSAYIGQVNTVAQVRAVVRVIPRHLSVPPEIYNRARQISVSQATAASRMSRNIAQTLEIGRYNAVTQIQLGSNNISNVGILKGLDNSVGVLQVGHSLRSNLVLLGTKGLSVGVIQPNGSAPVNMLIARLPNGALLIKR